MFEFLVYAALIIPPFILYRVRNASKSWLWIIWPILVLFQTKKIPIIEGENAFLDTYFTVLATTALILAIRKTFFVKTLPPKKRKQKFTV